jgi:hypothetical protein
MEDATPGIMLAIEVLAEQLIKQGSLDRAGYISELKNAYNSLQQDTADERGGQTLHTLIRHLERGPVERG